MIARSVAGFVLVPHFGFICVSLGSPLAWVCADLFLIPAYLWVIKQLKMKFGGIKSAVQNPKRQQYNAHFIKRLQKSFPRRIRLNCNIAIVRYNDLTDKSKTQSYTAKLTASGFIHAKERFKHAILKFFRDTISGILH